MLPKKKEESYEQTQQVVSKNSELNLGAVTHPHLIAYLQYR